MNQKLVNKGLYYLQKTLETIYFLSSLWIGVLFILSIPIWAPLYILVASMTRSLNFIKKILELPTQLFKSQLTEPIHFAILKGNGKYLRSGSQDVLLFQLYDYTLRKFLSIQQLDPNMKIAEIEGETLSPLKFLKTYKGINNIKCLQSQPNKLQKQKENYPEVEISETKYDIQEFSNEYDSIIVFNLKQKLQKNEVKVANGQNKLDILKILGYVRHHLSDKGFVVFGDFFESEGQIKVIEELFNVYGFQIQESENIQKNITYAEKLIYKRTKKFWEENLLQTIRRKFKKMLKLKRDYSQKQFYVFILSKKTKQE